MRAIKYFQISVPDEQRRDPNKLYNPTTLKDISGNYSVPKVRIHYKKVKNLDLKNNLHSIREIYDNQKIDEGMKSSMVRWKKNVR